MGKFDNGSRYPGDPEAPYAETCNTPSGRHPSQIRFIVWPKAAWMRSVASTTVARGCSARFGKGLVSKLSILNDILNEAVIYLDGRDDVDAIGHVLDSKPKAVQELWLEEARYDDENRREYYELFGPDKFEDALEADIVEIFESELNS